MAQVTCAVVISNAPQLTPEHSPPPGPRCALLSAFGGRAGLWLPRDRLWGFWRLLVHLVELPLKVFYPSALLLKLVPDGRLKRRFCTRLAGKLSQAVGGRESSGKPPSSQ